MRRIAFAVLLVVASTGHAQTLYKCVSHGDISYQQAPCPPSARTARTIETTPEPPPTAADQAEQERKAQRDRAESAFLSHLAGTDRFAATPRRSAIRSSTRHPDDQTATSCRMAKATRENTLRRVGLNRTFDLLRNLDEEVAAACSSR